MTHFSQIFLREKISAGKIKKQEKPSLQYVSDFQSLQDSRWIFFLVSKLPGKTIHLASSSLASRHILREQKHRLLSQSKKQFISGFSARRAMFLPPWRLCFGTKPYWVSGLCKSLLLGTRTEEQDVGPKATAIVSGVFIVFFLDNNLQANNGFYWWASQGSLTARLGVRVSVW